ncbi:MAG: hypothetical protein HKM99_12290 [Flavobacteriaceae bacterium]|nr:hypothetical protein [Flavobacteriaceae bacterium]
MKTFLILISLLFLSGCATVSDIIGLNYDSEKDYRLAVDARIAERKLDPAVAETVRQNLYALWEKDRETVLDAYELDEAVKTVIINKLAE